MNVLALSHEYPPLGGGGANAAYNLLRGFVNKGHRVTLITTDSSFCFQYEYNMTPEECYANIEIIYVKSKRRHKEQSSLFEMFDYMIKAYCQANKLVKEKKNNGNESLSFDVCMIFFGIPSGPI